MADAATWKKHVATLIQDLGHELTMYSRVRSPAQDIKVVIQFADSGRGKMIPSIAMRVLRSAGSRLVCRMAPLAMLVGCASLAVNPCDTIPDRDGKYFGRFFLGVATLGLSEVTIRQEEIRQAYQGSPDCPVPQGVRVVQASRPNPAGSQSAAVGTLVNGAPWTIVIYLNQDPDAPGAMPLTFLEPNASMKLAFRAGQHRLAARPTGAAPGSLPRVTWSRQLDVDPRVTGFKLQFNEADFR
jgi:hypothetical protein